jgi:hypothetical protein
LKVNGSRHDIAEKMAHLALNNNHSLTYIMAQMTMLEEASNKYVDAAMN